MNGIAEEVAIQPADRRGWLRFNGLFLRQHRRHLLTLVVPWLLLLLLGMPLLWNELERVVREPALRARDSVREETVQILTRSLDLLRHDVVSLADLPPELISADTRPDSVAARLFLKLRIDGLFGTYAGPLWLMPLRDLLSFAVFLLSLFGETVHWRGGNFAVEPSGAMSQI